jgi:hypothetical protein
MLFEVTQHGGMGREYALQFAHYRFHFIADILVIRNKMNISETVGAPRTTSRPRTISETAGQIS